MLYLLDLLLAGVCYLFLAAKVLAQKFVNYEKYVDF